MCYVQITMHETCSSNVNVCFEYSSLKVYLWQVQIDYFRVYLRNTD